MERYTNNSTQLILLQFEIYSIYYLFMNKELLNIFLTELSV